VKKETKSELIQIGIWFGIVIVIILAVSAGYLGWKYVYMPRSQSIDRLTFEQTRSYVHGKIQDLAKYYKEYQRTDDDGKKVIENFIVMEFAEFDKKHIKDETLQAFLVQMRGF